MINRLLKSIIIGVICISIFPITEVSAKTSTDLSPISFNVIKDTEIINTAEITPRALDLEVIYRSYNGFIQYRRWDKTNNCWYDPAWITIGPIE